MRFGVCTGPDNMEAAQAAGFDFVEWPLASTVRPETAEAEVMPALHGQLKRARLRPETWNLFLPGDMKIVGDSVDDGRIRNYLNAAFARVASLGGEVVVFGSGGARRVPDGFPRERAWAQIADFLSDAGPIAAAQNVVLAIEPLNHSECNILNSVAEALRMAADVSLPAVRVLSDLYHVATDGQSYDETRQAGNWLAHVHVASPDRRAPVLSDAAFLLPFFRVLKDMDYAGRVSVEGNWTNFASQSTECVDALLRAWDAA